MWRYRELYRLLMTHFRFSIGEGGTPLLHTHNLSLMLGTPHLLIKDNARTPPILSRIARLGLVIS